jgi:uncharacterized protein (DUF2235 family)
MKKNIVICSDGTGNTFDKSVSNVTRLIRLLALDSAKQIVFYDQGIGTNAKRLEAVKSYCDSIHGEKALFTLPGPREGRFYTGIATRVLGLLGGYGLKANVNEMYCTLSQYCGADDDIFLFGFSRGAFTVRALAGLLYRCGLPDRNVSNDAARFNDCFNQAWKLYQPMQEDEVEVASFRRRHGAEHDCEIYFLGLWDTVKSYGGLRPVMLPHLRHNPMVRKVRHALALDERRSWFNATTWGQLDSDKCGAKLRLKAKDLSKYESQDIDEVWFRGCHSDVGGGDVQKTTAEVALRWMLREAHAAGLLLNCEGERFLRMDDPTQPVEIHESLRWMWWLTEILPRWEIDNSGTYPVRKFAWGRTGRRTPDRLTRNGKISLHKTVGLCSTKNP